MVPLSGCTSLYRKGIGMNKKKSASEMMLQSAFAFYGTNSTPKYFFVKQNFIFLFHQRKTQGKLEAPAPLRPDVQPDPKIIRHLFYQIQTHAGCFLFPIGRITGKTFFKNIGKIACPYTHTVIADTKNRFRFLCFPAQRQFRICGTVFYGIAHHLSQEKLKPSPVCENFRMGHLVLNQKLFLLQKQPVIFQNLLQAVTQIHKLKQIIFPHAFQAGIV